MLVLLASKKDSDSDAILLMRAAEIVSNNILRIKYTFNGSLVGDVYDSNPPSLILLVQMILNGTNI